MKPLTLASATLAVLLVACASRPDDALAPGPGASADDIAAAADRLAARGRELDQAGQADAALRDFDGALRLQPTHVRARIDRAWLHLRAGRPDQALADADRALLFGPNDPTVRTTRCVAQVASERSDAGLKHCQYALLSPGHDASTHTALGQALLVLGRHREAATSFERALAAEPSHMPALYGRGAARLQAGDPAGQADLDEALRQSPRAAQGLVGLTMGR